ncbi:hypothetical protein MBLNU230_g5955t1 [Neophaeotheca triangularis]
MKLLTLNFLTCARKACKTNAAAFPLHPKEAELEQVEIELNTPFMTNILPRLDWEAMKGLASELGLPNLPAQVPDPEALTTHDGQPSQTGKDLHALLVETSIAAGKLVCGNCGHEYAVKEGIANFLLPSHLV